LPREGVPDSEQVFVRLANPSGWRWCRASQRRFALLRRPDESAGRAPASYSLTAAAGEDVDLFPAAGDVERLFHPLRVPGEEGIRGGLGEPRGWRARPRVRVPPG